MDFGRWVILITMIPLHFFSNKAYYIRFNERKKSVKRKQKKICITIFSYTSKYSFTSFICNKKNGFHYLGYRLPESRPHFSSSTCFKNGNTGFLLYTMLIVRLSSLTKILYAFPIYLSSDLLLRECIAFTDIFFRGYNGGGS